MDRNPSSWLCRSRRTQGGLGVQRWMKPWLEEDHSYNQLIPHGNVYTSYQIPAQESPKLLPTPASDKVTQKTELFESFFLKQFAGHLLYHRMSLVFPLSFIYWLPLQLFSPPKKAPLPPCSAFLKTCGADSLLKLMRLLMSTPVCSAQITKGHSAYWNVSISFPPCCISIQYRDYAEIKKVISDHVTGIKGNFSSWHSSKKSSMLKLAVIFNLC